MQRIPLVPGGVRSSFVRVRDHRLRDGIRSGLIAAAATAGVLIGLGIAHGSPWRPVNAIAHIAFGSRALIMEGFHPVITSVALLLHIVSSCCLGAMLSVVTPRWRGWPLVIPALAIAGLAYVLARAFAPGRLRPGFEDDLTAWELFVTYLVLALSLAGGLALIRASRDGA